jgi:hypothetical protein
MKASEERVRYRYGSVFQWCGSADQDQTLGIRKSVFRYRIYFAFALNIYNIVFETHLENKRFDSSAHRHYFIWKFQQGVGVKADLQCEIHCSQSSRTQHEEDIKRTIERLSKQGCQ